MRHTDTMKERRQKYNFCDDEKDVEIVLSAIITWLQSLSHQSRDEAENNVTDNSQDERF